MRICRRCEASDHRPRIRLRLPACCAHPAIWRGGDCAPEPASIASGFAELDAALPGGGWPRGALTELLLEREGIGELRLTLPALVRLQAEGRSVVWVAPPHRPYAPALAAAGLDLARLIVVRGCSAAEALWAYEQALRAPECGAAFGWMQSHEERVLRRLQVAAREGRTWGVLWRRPGQRASATAAPLRLALAPQQAQARRAGAETARRRAFATDRARSRARTRRAALSAARRHAGAATNLHFNTAGPQSRVARFTQESIMNFRPRPPDVHRCCGPAYCCRRFRSMSSRARRA